MKAHVFVPDGDGKSTQQEIPAAYAEAAKRRMKNWWNWSPRAKTICWLSFSKPARLPEEHIISGLDEEMRKDLRISCPLYVGSARYRVGPAVGPDYGGLSLPLWTGQPRISDD